MTVGRSRLFSFALLLIVYLCPSFTNGCFASTYDPIRPKTKRVSSGFPVKALLYGQSSVYGGSSYSNLQVTKSLADGRSDLSNERRRRFLIDGYVLAKAAFVGIISGLAVSLFKLSIDALKQLCYGSTDSTRSKLMLTLIPAMGGLGVALLGLAGEFPPGMKGFINEVDNETISKRNKAGREAPFRFLRKSLASVFTLGTGCSLGPEGPSVEIGMAASRLALNAFPLEFVFGQTGSKQRTVERRRVILSCGAAAGVAAGFNAPISGIFFALEIFGAALPPLEMDSKDESLETSSRNIGAILLSSVTSALISQKILGNHLHWILNGYKLKTPLTELPLYLLLGVMSGYVAFLFDRTVSLSSSFFSGTLGPQKLRSTMKGLPKAIRPVIGGLLCGLVGLAFPQILFFGYSTLNSLLSNYSLPTSLLLSLLVVKTVITGLSKGSGLVGGLFAPSLFLGAMLGASFHNVIGSVLDTQAIGSSIFQLADVPAYSMVGSACVLAAMFRAPLTASLLLFELTRDYDVILPLMASAGVAAVVRDIVDSKGRTKK